MGLHAGWRFAKVATAKLADRLLSAGLAIALLSMPAVAGPPFLTDDPEPVEFRHYEFYVFSTLDRLAFDRTALGSGGSDYAAVFPAFEFNAGVAPNLQLHLAAPVAYSVGDSAPSGYGIGDIELGAKYRFVKETKRRPQMGVFPMVELPSGDSSRGLGNGEAWGKFPLWLQKSWGPWTSYGGAGYTINRAPGMRDHIFAGWLVQRELSKKLTLGAEWFDPGRQSDAGRETHLINAGGIYSFNDNFSLLFSAGHSVQGESHTVAYLALYWTWGPPSPKDSGRAATAHGVSSWLGHGSALE